MVLSAGGWIILRRWIYEEYGVELARSTIWRWTTIIQTIFETASKRGNSQASV